MEPAARKQQLKALVYFLSQGGVLPSARATVDPDKELTLKYLEAVGSEFDVPRSSVGWADQVEKAYPLVVFSKVTLSLTCGWLARTPVRCHLTIRFLSRGQSYCPYSKKAKSYLRSVGASQEPYIIEVDLRRTSFPSRHSHPCRAC
jgi:hypothetical protein